MFSTLQDIKTYCESRFANASPVKTDSAILVTPLGEKTYRLIIYLLLPSEIGVRAPFNTELESIKTLVDESGFAAKTRYGTVQPVGYYFELSVQDKAR